jgi:hypothetical protein
LNILKILIEKDFFLSRDFDLTNREKISIFLQIYQLSILLLHIFQILFLLTTYLNTTKLYL